MIDVINKKRVACNSKVPSFNYKDEENALYCNCKTCDMVDIKYFKESSFQVPKWEDTLYCSECKIENLVCVISKKCISCELKHPAFKYLNEKQPLYCNDCKQCGMIDVKTVSNII